MLTNAAPHDHPTRTESTVTTYPPKPLEIRFAAVEGVPYTEPHVLRVTAEGRPISGTVADALHAEGVERVLGFARMPSAEPTSESEDWTSFTIAAELAALGYLGDLAGWHLAVRLADGFVGILTRPLVDSVEAVTLEIHA